MTRASKERIIVKAYDYASEFDLKKARGIVLSRTSGKLLDDNPLLVQIGSQKMIMVFDYGAVVLFDHSDEEIGEVLTLLDSCALRKNRRISQDEFMLHLSPRMKMPEGTDELTVRELNRDIALVVGVVLSRSVSVEYYESLVANALATFELTISELATRGWMPKGRRELTKQVGFALSVEHELAYNISVLDDPDIVWDGGAKIEALYASLKREFDLVDRIRLIQQKVSIISRSSTFVLGRLEAQRSNMLEWIIILLILSEIILALVGTL
jgi:required for meiotic nuclear division protein 1